MHSLDVAIRPRDVIDKTESSSQSSILADIIISRTFPLLLLHKQTNCTNRQICRETVLRLIDTDGVLITPIFLEIV